VTNGDRTCGLIVANSVFDEGVVMLLVVMGVGGCIVWMRMKKREGSVFEEGVVMLLVVVGVGGCIVWMRMKKREGNCGNACVRGRCCRWVLWEYGSVLFEGRRSST